MDDDLLIVEELMLLLLADDGTAIAGANVLHCLLPAAIFVELALTARLDVHSHRRSAGTLIHARRTSPDPAIDPALAEARGRWARGSIRRTGSSPPSGSTSDSPSSTASPAADSSSGRRGRSSACRR
ncbi:GPP34 family phosphoprotein [Brevibacterium casei]|nr:GPP34 family phosphoprotein [Brevibacterium casei]